MPESHDGANAFTFGLTFSEEVKLSYRTLRDEAFNVAAGRCARRDAGSRGATWGGTSRSSRTRPAR